MLCLSKDTLLLGPLFQLHVTYGILNLTPSLLFIHPRINQRPWTKPKAQHTILGLYTYNSPSKLRFFPLIQGEKVGFFFFFRIKTIHLFGSHAWDYHFARYIIAIDVSEPAMRN